MIIIYMKSGWLTEVMGNRHWNIAKGTTDLRVEYSWQSNYPSEIQTSFKKLILSLDKTLQNTQQTWGWGLSSFLYQSRNHPQARHWQPSTLRSYSASKDLPQSFRHSVIPISSSFCQITINCHQAIIKLSPSFHQVFAKSHFEAVTKLSTNNFQQH